MQILKPPTPLIISQRPAIFLAGSIAMGAASAWQTEVELALHDHAGTILNPRRDAWDATWEQSIDFAPFHEQVTWELDAQEQADLIAMYFDPATQAPITLLELGLFAHTGKVIVCCPTGFWRKGNVDIVCQRYTIPTVADLPSMIEVMRTWLGIRSRESGSEQ